MIAEKNDLIAFSNMPEEEQKASDLCDNAEAYKEIGDLYKEGDAVRKNYEKAMFWYSKSAEKDYPPALASIGLMYEFGLGVEKDLTKAYEMYKKAESLDDKTLEACAGIRRLEKVLNGG